MSCTMLGVESTFVGRCGGDISAVTVYVAVPSTPDCNDGFIVFPFAGDGVSVLA